MKFIITSEDDRLLEKLFRACNITSLGVHSETPIIHTEQSCNCDVCTVHKKYIVDLNTMLDLDRFFDSLDKHLRKNEVTLTRLIPELKFKEFIININTKDYL